MPCRKCNRYTPACSHCFE